MIYLDNGATTLKKPDVVKEAVMAALDHLGNAGRGGTETALSSARVIFEARERLNRLINGESADHIVFTANITESLNTAIQGLFKPGDHIITTALEHNSVLRPCYLMAERGVELTILPADEKGNIHLSNLKATIRPNTKGIVVTHASNLTGNITPVKEISRIAHEHGVLVILDAAQTCGARPIDVKDLDVDVFCFTGHKSLMGPQGTGGMYIRPGVDIAPLKAGGTGIDTFSHTQPAEYPTHLEAGTMNSHGIAGLSAAVGYLLEYGVDRIEQEEMALYQRFIQGVRDLPNVTLYGDIDATAHAPIVTLNIGDMDSADVGMALADRYDIIVRTGGHCAPLMHQTFHTEQQGAVRFSLSHYTTTAEIDTAIQAVREIATETMP
ncbi:MAG: aminotransferase class V-fold PLP-dependent enzyme [Aerococcus sp.]|nr:aminotransferase class V-fold PLP-dependent enzyme [Aerococcus sp.]